MSRDVRTTRAKGWGWLYVAVFDPTEAMENEGDANAAVDAGDEA